MKPVAPWRVWFTVVLTAVWGIAMIEFARAGMLLFTVLSGVMFGLNAALLWLLTRRK